MRVLRSTVFSRERHIIQVTTALRDDNRTINVIDRVLRVNIYLYNIQIIFCHRDDLNDRNGVYPFEGLGYSNFGAIDAKVTSHEMSKWLKFLAISGPTDGTGGGLGTYCWSKSHADNVSHVGLPDCWDFKPVTRVWDSINIPLR